jgi:hypothetical protein
VAFLLCPALARAQAERFSAGGSAGIELSPDSTGGSWELQGLFGVGGTVRAHRLACLDARLGLGTADEGSETTRVSETRLRVDLRAALCPSVHRAVTFVVGIGPALGVSLLRARVGDRETSYEAFDLGGSLDGGVLLRISPIFLRADLELALLTRLAFGTFLAAGVAL